MLVTSSVATILLKNHQSIINFLPSLILCLPSKPQIKNMDQSQADATYSYEMSQIQRKRRDSFVEDISQSLTSENAPLLGKKAATNSEVDDDGNSASPSRSITTWATKISTKDVDKSSKRDWPEFPTPTNNHWRNFVPEEKKILNEQGLKALCAVLKTGPRTRWVNDLLHRSEESL